VVTIQVFVSYRREDSKFAAGRLGDRLRLDPRFKLFMDVDQIQAGDLFPAVVRKALEEADVLLPMIGQQWLTLTAENGGRRIDQPDDWVAEEIGIALRRGTPIIPVLFDGARMPNRDDLPPALVDLADWQALRIDYESFGADSERLIDTIERVLRRLRITELQNAVRALAKTGNWTAVLAADAELARLDPEAGDLDGLATKARTELLEAELAASYAKGVKQLDEHDWAGAEKTFGTLLDRRASYRDAEALLALARRSRARAAAWRPSRSTAYFAVTAVLVILGILLAFFWAAHGISGGGRGDEPTPTPTQTPTKTTAPAPPLKWQPETDLPEPLEAAGVTVFGDSVWVVGGNAPSAGRPALDKVWFYQNGWQPGPKLPVRLDSMSVASDGKRLFVVGGRTTDSKGRNQKISRDVWVLDGPDDDSWEVLNRLPQERAGGAVAWDGQRLVFAGGVNRRDLNGDGKAENVNHADVWVWEGKAKWREIGQLQRQREDLVAASDGNGRVWFLGGADVRGEDPRVPLGAVDLVEEDRITPLSDIAPVRSSAAVWLADRGVCLFGGVTPTETKDSITKKVVCVPETASPSPTLRPLPPLTLPRAGLGAAVGGKTIWLVGGFGPERKDGPVRPGLSVVEVLVL
jgi:hypothetical protein